MFEHSTNYLRSYYSASSPAAQHRRPRLAGELDVDVLVVGAGFTGLYTALNLAEAGLKGFRARPARRGVSPAMPVPWSTASGSPSRAVPSSASR